MRAREWRVTVFEGNIDPGGYVVTVIESGCTLNEAVFRAYAQAQERYPDGDFTAHEVAP